MRKSIAAAVADLFGRKRSVAVVKERVMPASRYFPNPYPDYQAGTVVNIPSADILTQVNCIVESIQSHIRPVEVEAQDGLYLGTAGIAYMFYHLSRIPLLHGNRSAYIQASLEYIKPSIDVALSQVSNRENVPGLLLGNCGVYAIATVIYKMAGDEGQSNKFLKMYNDAADVCKDMYFLRCGSDELFVGRAGYICGALWMAKEANCRINMDDIYEICRVTMASGRKYSQIHRSRAPLMFEYYGVEYLGAAHGLCSILQMLMSVPGYLDANPADTRDIKSTVDYVLDLQDSDGNFPAATDESDQSQHELVHWCHGAAGIIYLMAKAYLVWHDTKYRAACEKMSDVIWQKGLLKKGPGICHGVAGNAYAFLLLYRITSNDKYLYRAIQFAGFMETDIFKGNARTPDSPYSLYEGFAGTVCFLADLTSPSTAVFPFSDVF